AGADLARFDELAGHLSSADEAYEAAVHLDTEAARSLAAALVELERVLSQRHSTTAPLEQARKGRERQGAPEVIIQQAINLQAALARAEADKREAVRQADDDYQGARMASRQAQSALKEAELDLRHSLANLSTGPLECGPGVPLPGLLTTFRDRLDGALATADKAATRARSVEHAARSRVEWEARALESLLNAGPPVIDPLETAVNWAGSEHFGPDGVVFADDTFTRFGPEGVADLVTTLAGRGCQVIYLTENPQVLGWAISLPGEVGGASTIANSRNKEPGSVGD
ncbi:MAG TPA: hypothetical protein VED59_08550, partial [Acidimicrobiales bacterium]|nr:hypothetical protein [Acidimicrobiales bacterium]